MPRREKENLNVCSGPVAVLGEYNNDDLSRDMSTAETKRDKSRNKSKSPGRVSKTPSRASKSPGRVTKSKSKLTKGAGNQIGSFTMK